MNKQGNLKLVVGCFMSEEASLRQEWRRMGEEEISLVVI
jgi:hypothetical protein